MIIKNIDKIILYSLDYNIDYLYNFTAKIINEQQ